MAVLTYVFAICEGPTAAARFWGIVLPILGAAAFIGLMIAAMRGSGTTGSLSLLFVVTAVAGAVTVSTPNGLTDAGGDYVARSFTALFVGLLLAVGWTVVAKVNGLRALVVGGLGGVAPILWLVGLFIFGLAAGNTCID
jgi:hypothetical protein